jgi:hypothetical protein
LRQVLIFSNETKIINYQDTVLRVITFLLNL